MAVGDMLPLNVCCYTLTIARNIDLTGFNIKSGVCWHAEMKNIKTMKTLIYRSGPPSVHPRDCPKASTYWNYVLMILAQITDNRNFHYNGICYKNDGWYRFLSSTIYCRKYSKIITIIYIFLPTSEVYLAFYQRNIMFFPF